jgi:hypothetical protein
VLDREEPLLHGKSQADREEQHRADRQRHLQETADGDELRDAAEARQGELEADGEQQDDDADVREALDVVAPVDEAEPERAD